MKLYSKGDNYTLYEGDMLDLLDVIPLASVDAVVTDPPYELNFMNKSWDGSGIAFKPETWRKCYEVLKSGGYLLAFGGSRTFHRIACAIEEAGFELRDTIIWLYGSGFPKSYNIGLALDKRNGVESEIIGTKAEHDIRGNAYANGDGRVYERQIKRARNNWEGWGTALKPAFEPVIIARKPCEGSTLDNVIKYGVGALNLDACRINVKTPADYEPQGRYPSNVILTYDETDYKEVCGGLPETNGDSKPRINDNRKNAGNSLFLDGVHNANNCYFDDGNASRYFYCAKASTRDRDEGLDDLKTVNGGSYNFRADGSLDGYIPAKKNIHPTVKPCDLMQYLVRLITPKGGVVLDPFNGSGSTGKAVMYENRDRQSNYKYIGIELTPEYLPIADARIKYAITAPLTDDKPEQPLKGQIDIYDLLGGKQ